MNYQHAGQNKATRTAQRVVSASRQKQAADAMRIKQLNRLTRYPSLAATVASAAALISVLVHVIK